MPTTAPQILKSARNAHNLSQLQVASMLYVSVDQIKRYERGEAIPEMSDVDILEEQLPEPGLFRRWARAQYPEIVKYFGASDERDLGLIGAVVNVKLQMADVMRIQDRVERDAVDGRFDDRALLETYQRELLDAQKAIEASLTKLREVK